MITAIIISSIFCIISFISIYINYKLFKRLNEIDEYIEGLDEDIENLEQEVLP